MSKKQEQIITLLPDYGKRKLLSYANSFKQLADTFLCLTKEEQITLLDHGNREEYVTQRRMMENRGLIADHLNEIALIMQNIAQESYRFMRLSDKQVKQITELLKEQSIRLDDIYILEGKQGKIEVTMGLKAIGTTLFSVKEIAGALSVVLNRRMVPAVDMQRFLTSEEQTVLFEEESKYLTLTGVAQVTKEGEHVSGDSHSILQVNNGTMMILLSDGMGTGEKASKDSQEVIELMERLLEAGFSKEMAVQITNGVLIAGSESGNMSTLDACELNLYTGELELIKVGSAVTYLKHGRMIEQMETEHLPLGVFSELEVCSMKQNLSDGDYIILLSDGIVDAIPSEARYALLGEIINEMELQNPQEMANYILQMAIRAGQGRIKDDMTVMVIGTWETKRS